jgi:hypothetical protein
MKPQRNPRYLAWIRTQPCCVCGSRKAIEASHTGPHGIGQKSPDTSAIPLCAKHHRTAADSYHRLGPRKFSAQHNLDIPAIVRRLNLKPTIRIEAGWFVTYLEAKGACWGKDHPAAPTVPTRRLRAAGGSRRARHSIAAVSRHFALSLARSQWRALKHRQVRIEGKDAGPRQPGSC